jgi:hypothetical protein
MIKTEHTIAIEKSSIYVLTHSKCDQPPLCRSQGGFPHELRHANFL